MKPTLNNDLERFIYQKCFDRIWEAVAQFVSENPGGLDLAHSRIKYPDTATVEDAYLEFAANIIIDEDTLSFDAVVSCDVVLEEEGYHDRRSGEANLWFRVNCTAVIEDKVKRITVHSVEIYSKGKHKPTTGVAATENIVPKIYPEDWDVEATKFLQRYCPQALVTPMAVPIEQIVQNDMGLDILQGHRLSDDFSLFGQICFSKGKVNVYDLWSDKYEELEVERGTILIDAFTYWERNVGCVNNTIAHEAFHWHRHRIYAAVKSILRGEKLIACRCPTKSYIEKDPSVWTDEKRMEVQASHIAPRILMPKETVLPKISELLLTYAYTPISVDKTEILECVIDELASIYKVSKQSAKIRMIDLGFKEAEGVYNYTDNFTPYFASINARDAFYEYCDNDEFRSILDSGLFCYANGYFVINNEKYVAQSDDGNYSLTDYAYANLSECTLQFTYHRVNMREHGKFHTDFFHRDNPAAFERLPHYDADRNIPVIDTAQELARKVAEFESQYTTHKIFTKTFWQRAQEIMAAKHWNSSVFSERTLLNEMTFSRVKNNFDSLPDVRTVMAICAGLDLDIGLTNELLSLAGHTLSNSREHQAYRFIITGYSGRSIHERNEFLESVDIAPLGSKQRI